MKKLKLVGIKKIWFWEIRRVVAEVFVQEGKVIVESRNPKIKEDLQREIDQFAYRRGFLFRWSKDIKDKQGRIIRHELWARNQKPGDPGFLEALRGTTWFWKDKKFGGYEIYETISKIVDE